MPEPKSESSPDQSIEALYKFVAEQLQNGARPAAVAKNLVEMGLDAATADIVVANMKQAMTKAHREAGQKHMLYGALWCIGGIVVTAVTYQAAEGGGRYVVAWGAILFGAIQFYRGMMQSSGSSSD